MARTALLLVLGCVASCVLELDEEPACGDGYVQPGVEECDPAVPESFVDACVEAGFAGRVGACLAPQCGIDWDACEDPCGNGVLDPQEECDPGIDGTEWVQPGGAFEGSGPACAELSPSDGMGSYVGGRATRCLSDCRWDRTPCDRCGDGKVQPDEVCETNFTNHDAVDAWCRSACVGLDVQDRPERVWCNTSCANDCRAYEAPADETLTCCIPNGEDAHPAFDCCGFEENGLCVRGLGGE